MMIETLGSHTCNCPDPPTVPSPSRFRDVTREMDEIYRRIHFDTPDRWLIVVQLGLVINGDLASPDRFQFQTFGWEPTKTRSGRVRYEVCAPSRRPDMSSSMRKDDDAVALVPELLAFWLLDGRGVDGLTIEERTSLEFSEFYRLAARRLAEDAETFMRAMPKMLDLGSDLDGTPLRDAVLAAQKQISA